MNQFERLFAVSGLSLDRLRTFLRVVEAGNLSKAALGDPTKQSQFSRQIKEMEAFFGVALTRRVGRRIEITEEGNRLALLIRRQFSELDDFRESMAGRSINVRLGSQGSIIDWLVIPRLTAYQAMGNVTLEMEQMRSLDVVRAVADGRLDFGIVREDALPEKRKHWKLGQVGYSLFVPKALAKMRQSLQDIISTIPIVEILPGGQFTERWHVWLDQQQLRPRIIARVSSFTDAAKIVHAGHSAAVLPDLATVEFDAKKFDYHPLPALKKRSLVLISNARSMDRVGLSTSAAESMAKLLRWQ